MLSQTTSTLGYRHPDFVHSLASLGRPLPLHHCGGWIIERDIPGTPYRDAMGPYPIFSCQDWGGVSEDLRDLREHGLISLVLVTDPILDESARNNFRCFDLIQPFKEHYVAELDRPIREIASRHHAYYARKAARSLEVEVVAQPLDYLQEWHALYGTLVARHGITDLRSFSLESFRQLFSIPGLHLLRALHGGRPVGAQLILLQDDVAHAHLAAFSPEGYELGASYLLDWHALEHFSGKARLLNWGGGTGNDEGAGLSRYKQGWATRREMSYLLGAIFDMAAYTSLGGGASATLPDYFPAYRRGEFG